MNKSAVRKTKPGPGQTEPPLTRIAQSLSKPFVRLLSQRKPIPTLFCELVNKLQKWFSISKATLAIYHDQTATLKLASWWDMYCFKEGVLLSLPTENSLFYRAMQSSRLLHEQVNGRFPGNYVERLLMTSRTTAALAVYPLMFDGVVYGVISLSSPVPYAFDILEEGYLSTVFEKMASVVADRGPKEFWEPMLTATWQGVNPAEAQGCPTPNPERESDHGYGSPAGSTPIEPRYIDGNRTLRVIKTKEACGVY